MVVDLSGQAIVLDPRGEGSDGVDARAQNQYASYMQNTPNDKAAPAGSAQPPGN